MVGRQLSICAVLAVVVATALGGQSYAAGNSEDRAGYIVVLRDSARPDVATARLERRHGFRSDFRYEAALRGFAARLSAAQVAGLRADPEVALVAADGTVVADGTAPLASLEIAPTGIRRIGATDTTAGTTQQASDASVAVIDTGIDLNH